MKNVRDFHWRMFLPRLTQPTWAPVPLGRAMLCICVGAFGLHSLAGCGDADTPQAGESQTTQFSHRDAAAEDVATQAVEQVDGQRTAEAMSESANGSESESSDSELVELKLELPQPQFIGTPAELEGIRLDPERIVPEGEEWVRPPFMVPPGLENVALGKQVTSSDPFPIIGDLEMVTNGDKEATDGSFVELGWGPQWVQIDLEDQYEIFAIVVWHYHANARVYRDVVVQVSDDPDFVEGVKTVFNNDHDNTLGHGAGEDYEFITTYQGELIDAGGVKGRYVRLWSNGSTEDDQNHYTEVEVYGRSPQ